MNDKRTLKRQYREAGPRPGVYAIRHLASGRLLVDGSANPQAALNRHVFELRMKQHRQRALQADWDAGGEAVFVFEVLDVVAPRDEPGFDPARELQALVALWREELRAPADGGYAASAASMSAAMSSGLVCGA